MVYLWSCLLGLSSKTFSQPPCRWPSCPIAPGQWPYGQVPFQPRCQPPWQAPPCIRYILKESSHWNLFNTFLLWHTCISKNIPSKSWISLSDTYISIVRISPPSGGYLPATSVIDCRSWRKDSGEGSYTLTSYIYTMSYTLTPCILCLHDVLVSYIYMRESHLLKQ